MATIQQVQRGVAAYIDQEMVPRMGDATTRWLVGGAGALLANNLGKTLEANKNNPMLAAFGVFDEEGGIDVDALYHAFASKMTEPVKLDIPVLSRIVGKIGLNRNDLDRFVQFIKEA